MSNPASHGMTPEEATASFVSEIKELKSLVTIYQDIIESTNLLVKELDSAWNGDAVVENPNLWELVLQIKTERAFQKTKINALLNTLRAVNGISWVIKELENKGWTDMQDEHGVFDRVKEVIDHPKQELSTEGYTILQLIKERDEYKRLYDFRGEVLRQSCMHCGKKPARIMLTGKN